MAPLSDPTAHPPTGRVSGGPASFAVRLLQCEENLEDGQNCPRFHVVRGDVEPVPPVVNGHLRVARAVFLRVDEEVSAGDPRPVEGRSVRA